MSGHTRGKRSLPPHCSRSCVDAPLPDPLVGFVRREYSQGRLWRAPVEIQEAPSRALGYASMWGFVHGEAPPSGQLYVSSHSLAIGLTVIDDMFVTIRAPSQELLLAAARALKLA